MKRTGGGVTSSVVVLDNGAGYCKAGMAGQPEPTAVVPNCLARPRSAKKWLVADQLQECDDIQSIAIKRPIDRGYMISPDVEREIWDRIFKTHLKINPAESGLMLVEPLFTLSSIQKATDELVFEDFGFQSFCVTNAAVSTHAYQAQKAPASILARGRTSLVVDSGFSFTHAAPVFQNKVLTTSAKRINLGGKALTNYLKELVSYRAWNVMDETYIMEDVKERLCFVSTDIERDLNIARLKGKGNSLRREYVLPDGVKHKRGFVKELDPVVSDQVVNVSDEDDEEDEDHIDEDQIGEGRRRRIQRKQAPSTKQEDQQELTLTNERFLVPEMLFHPADLGMNEAGLAECIVRAVNACEPELHALLYHSVLLTGGNTLLPGFKDRLEQELRPLVTDDYNINIEVIDCPIVAAWKGASLMAARPEYHSWAVSKTEYEEEGTLRCRQRRSASEFSIATNKAVEHPCEGWPNFDIKFFTDCQLGMMGWAVLIASYAVKQLAATIMAAGLLCIWINYDADLQRQQFREIDGKEKVWGNVPKKNLMNEAAILAARRELKEISKDEIADALERIIAGPEKKNAVVSDEKRKLVAYHEAGHALVGALMPEYDPVAKISIVPRGGAGGLTFFAPSEERLESGLYSRSYLENQMAVALGGRIAEEIIYGSENVTTGASNDFMQVSRVARQMVERFGFSDKIGQVSLGGGGGNPFLGQSAGQQSDHSTATADIIDSEVRTLVETAYSRAKTIMTTHIEILHKLATLLLEKEG